MMTTNVPLSKTPAGRGPLLCESGPIHVVSLYLITRHNSLIITETPSLEVLPTKAKEDPSSYEMRLSPAGHQPSISWSFPGVIIIIIIIFAMFIFYLFYKIVKLIFFIGYNFFQDGAQFFYMFRNAVSVTLYRGSAGIINNQNIIGDKWWSNCSSFNKV